MKLPQKRSLASADGRRVAQYDLAGEKLRPAGLATKPVVYRVIRTKRTRRGFGTIIHTLTTFTANRKRAAQLVGRWVSQAEAR